MPSDQGTCPACWSTEELLGAVCPQSAVAWGSSVSTLRVGILRFTGSCRHSVVHRIIQDSPLGKSAKLGSHLSRNDYFVHKNSCMVSTYEQPHLQSKS